MNIKSQKGMAMIPVLIILIVVSILGTTVYYASANEVLNSKSDENKTQAYYFARSGVEMAINLIKGGNCNNMSAGDEETYYGSLDGDFTEEETSDFNIKFTIGLDDQNYFIIDSLGIVRNGLAGGAETQSDLKFKINKNDIVDGGGQGGGQDGEGDILMSLFASKTLTINGSSRINGNVATNAKESGNVTLHGASAIKNGNLYIGPGADKQEVVRLNGSSKVDGEILNLPADLSFPLPVFPAFPDNLEIRPDLETPWISGEHYEISENAIDQPGYHSFGYYNSIEITGNRTLTIKLDGKDQVIRVKNLNISGNIVLEGTGRLYLYVEDSFNIGGSSQVNHNGDPNSLIMFYQGHGSLNFAGNTRFSGNIFAQNAEVSLAGSNNINGNIITGGDSVSVSGAADAYTRILYSPNANVTVSGSGNVLGVVIADSCTLNGNTSITAGSPLDTTFFNSLDWGDDGPPSLLLNLGQHPQEQETINWWQKGSWIAQ